MRAQLGKSFRAIGSKDYLMVFLVRNGEKYKKGQKSLRDLFLVGFVRVQSVGATGETSLRRS